MRSRDLWPAALLPVVAWCSIDNPALQRITMVGTMLLVIPFRWESMGAGAHPAAIRRLRGRLGARQWMTYVADRGEGTMRWGYEGVGSGWASFVCLEGRGSTPPAALSPPPPRPRP